MVYTEYHPAILLNTTDSCMVDDFPFMHVNWSRNCINVYYHRSYLCYVCQATMSVKISNLLICFCSFDLSCPILEKHILIENLYIVLSYCRSSLEC